MEKDKIGDMLSQVSPVHKKEILNNLIATLLKDLNETDKKEVFQAILTGRKNSGQVIDMVER